MYADVPRIVPTPVIIPAIVGVVSVGDWLSASRPAALGASCPASAGPCTPAPSIAFASPKSSTFRRPSKAAGSARPQRLPLHELARVQHDNPRVLLQREQVAIARDDRLGATGDGRGQYPVIVWIAADGFG